MNRAIAFIFACASGLHGCGGSSESGEQAAQGIWIGEITSSSGETLPSIGLVLDDGRYFFASDYDYSLLTIGSLSSHGANMSSDNLQSYSGRSSYSSGVLSGYVAGGSMNVEIIQKTGHRGIFTGKYSFDKSYNTKPVVKTLAGNYASPVNTNGSAKFKVDDQGNFSGFAANCAISGKIWPNHTTKNIYKVSLNTKSAPGYFCPWVHTFDGVATSTKLPGSASKSLAIVAFYKDRKGQLFFGMLADKI